MPDGISYSSDGSKFSGVSNSVIGSKVTLKGTEAKVEFAQLSKLVGLIIQFNCLNNRTLTPSFT